MASDLPQISHILETILYVKDLEKSKHFYQSIFNAQTTTPNPTSDRGVSFSIGNTTLLCFVLGKTTTDLVEDPSKPEYLIPKHGPSGQLLDVLLNEETNLLHQHFCFAVERVDEVRQWEQHLIDNEVPIIGKKKWERGGYSVYFSDPDGHIGEIASRGIWPHY